MPVEIDETELANLRGVAGVMQKMLNNPKTRGKILEAQKVLNPDAVIPEIDSAAPLKDAMVQLHKEVQETQKMIRTDKEEREASKAREVLEGKWAEGRAAARKAGYMAEGLEKLEKFMEEKGVADHEIAIAAFEKLNPPEEPVFSSGSRFDAFTAPSEGDDMKLLLEGNEQQFLNKKIKETLTDIRSGNR